MVGLNKMESKFGNCSQCKTKQASTRCDRCRGETCTSCVHIIVKAFGEIEIRHNACITNRGGK